MKRLIYIAIMVLSIGALLHMTYMYSTAMSGSEAPDRPLTHTPALQYNYNWIDLNTFNLFFPFYSQQGAVCRKPISGNLTGEEIASPFIKNYQFKKFETRKTTRMGKYFMQVKGNNIYESGNATMLIPKSYVKRSYPFFNPKTPELIIRKAD